MFKHFYKAEIHTGFLETYLPIKNDKMTFYVDKWI